MKTKKRSQLTLTILGTSSLTLALSACLSNEGGSGSSAAPAASASTAAVSAAASTEPAKASSKKKLYAQASTTCSPLSGTTSAPVVTVSYTSGLSGRLYSLNAGAPQPNTLTDLFTNSTDQGVNVFLNDVNVPTRLFNTGFPAADGHLLTDSTGQELVEWFGLDMYSSLTLGPNDQAGNYQLAMLSDDGAILSIGTGALNQYTQLINDDQLHPTRMACATESIELQKYQQIPIHLQYFQGPRWEIALVMMWRLVPPGQQCAADPECGATGNYTFFDPDNNSKPSATYTGLLTRGWVPLTSSNFEIPQESVVNPCLVPNYWAE